MSKNKINLGKRELVCVADTDIAKIYDLREPGGGWMQSTRLVFLSNPPQIIITGDLCPGIHGILSNMKYGIEWFGSHKSPGYLCEKFLREEWVPEKCQKELRAYANESERRKDRTKLREIARDIDGWVSDSGPAVSQHQTYEELCDLDYSYVDDGIPGYGYNPREADLLVAIQKQFADLYQQQQAQANA